MGIILKRGLITALARLNTTSKSHASVFKRYFDAVSVTSCGCMLQFHRTAFSRADTDSGVYVPKPGELKRSQSLRSLPKKKVEDVKKVNVAEVKSGEVFRDVMGGIYASKNRRLIAVEGVKVVEEALKFGLNLRYLFLLKSLKRLPELIQQVVERSEDRPQREEYERISASQEVHRISLKTLQEWSSLTTPPGIIGVFDKPSENFKSCTVPSYQKIPLTVVLDNVREPGNVGSILRTAAGLGCSVLLSKGCTDPWDSKALRGGNGAQFLVPMTLNTELANFSQYISLDYLQGCGTLSAPLDNRAAVCGSTETKKTGIAVFLADSGSKDDRFGIPVVPYTAIDYLQFKAVYLCLGGETHGLSNTLKEAVKDLKLVYPEDVKMISRISIPMQLPIDSLNVANALGIIGYEIARQYTKNFCE